MLALAHETPVLAPTQRRRNFRSAFGGLVVLCAALGGSAAGSPDEAAGADGARRPTRAPAAAGVVKVPGAHCAHAGRAVLALRDDQGFDAIRVIADTALPGAATDVTVLAGPSDRTLRTLGGGEWGLVMDEPLRARRVQVAIEPVLEAPAGACVERVELLRRGAVVATARIQ